MEDDSLFGILALLVFKVLAHFFAARSIARICGEVRSAIRSSELEVVTTRTAVGVLAGLVYSPVMSRYGLAPWSQPAHPWIFLLGVSVFSAAIWWWCVRWFYLRRAKQKRSVLYPLLVGVAWSLICDLAAIFRLVIVEKIWPI